VGFAGGEDSLRSSSKNMQSARDQPEVIQEYLWEEVVKRRVWCVGTAEEAMSLGAYCSPFGMIPKWGGRQMETYRRPVSP